MAIGSGTQNATKIFMIFGIPPVNSVTEVNALTTLWGPFSETYDITAIRTALNAALDAAAAVVVTEIETELGYWDSMRANPELRVYGDTGSAGVLADYKARTEEVRQRIAGLLGFYVPHGGFRYGRPADNDCRISR